MTCEELLDALNDHVDGVELGEVCQEYAQHLAGCNPCQVVVDNIRQTISLYKELQPYAIPAAFQDRLQQCLTARWEEKFGKAVMEPSSSQPGNNHLAMD